MYRKIAAVVGTAAVILGAGTAALAASGPDATGGTGSTSAPATSTPAPGNNTAGRRRHVERALVRHAVHGSIVTQGKNGYVRHTGIRGTITAVSPTALTVKATDGTTQTFVLMKATKVRERTPGQAKGSPGTISQLKTGDDVGVLGRGPESATGVPSAAFVVDGLK
jgi:hypothetical protein